MLTVCVGQAGNQIGGLLANYVGIDKQRSNSVHRFVFVDSEEKVVKSLIDSTSCDYVPNISSRDMVHDLHGRGNLWPWGYTGLSTSQISYKKARDASQSTEPLYNRVVDMLTNVIESFNDAEETSYTRLSSILMIHSLGGGTGSGFGSRLLEYLRDAYPSFHYISAVITPHIHGDTPLQHVNMTLALATVHECTNTVLYFQNDEVLNATSKKRKFLSSFLKSNGGKEAQSNFDPTRFSTREVNDTIAQSIFHACFQQSRSSLDFITTMATQHPARKYLDISSASDAVSSVVNSPVLVPSSTSSSAMAAPSSASASQLPSYDVSVMRRVSHQANLSWPQLSDELVELMSPSALIKLKSGSSGTLGHPAARQQQNVPSSAYIRNTSHVLLLASGSDLATGFSGVGSAPVSASRKPLTYTHASTLFAGQVPATSVWNLIDSKISRYLRLSVSSLSAAGRSDLNVSSHCRFLSSPVPIYSSAAPSSPGNLLTLVTNSSIVVPSLQACLENTAHKLQAGAFLHHYVKYGVTKDHIITALESIQSIVEAYKELD
jgi:Tubulin/FtsZ family, GTPase domain